MLASPPPVGSLGPCCYAADPCPRASSRRGRSHPPSSSALPKILRPSRSRRSSRLLERALLLGFRALLVVEETVDDRARGSLCRSASGSGYLPCPPPSPGCGIRVCVGWGVCVYIYVCVWGMFCVRTQHQAPISSQHRVLLVASAAAHWLRSKLITCAQNIASQAEPQLVRNVSCIAALKQTFSSYKELFVSASMLASSVTLQ